MARGKNREQTSSSCTVHLDMDLAQAVDQTMVQFGLSSRSETLVMMVKSWLSANPEQTTIFEVTQQAVREIRKFEFEGLANYFAERSKAYKAGRG